MPNDSHRVHLARGQRQHAQRGGATGGQQRQEHVGHGRDERLLAAAGPLEGLGVVLDDVHVVGDGQHHDQRDEHAAQHVEAEPHERVEPDRPQHADQHRPERQRGDPPRAEQDEQRRHRHQQDRRGERDGVGDGDPVVGLADLEAAVVVRAQTGWQMPIDGGADALDGAGAFGVDAILVEVDHDRQDRGVAGDQIAAQEGVGERGLHHGRGVDGAGARDQRPHLDPGVLAAGRLDGVGAGQAVGAHHEGHALDVAGDAAQHVEPGGGRHIGAGKGDDQRPRSGELLAEAVVVAQDRVFLREPGRDVVVDVGDLGPRGEGQGAGDDQEGEEEAKAIEEPGEREAHRGARAL